MAQQVCQRCGARCEGPGCALCGDTLLMQADPLVGRVVAGRYRVLRQLGEGGMGSVYLAEQVGIGHRVALKFLHGRFAGRQDIAQRFLNEARSYARIAHPHAITFHDFGQDEDGNLYISMEYVEGPDLKTLLVQQGRLPMPEAVEIVLQVADALEHAHASGVIHRDLKPENVIVRQGMRGPHAKVLDFGIAKLLGEGAAPLTVEGSIAGTPQYMPPEQIKGQPVDFRADVYVLGVVLFELLTGHNPFVAATIPETLYKQAHEPLPPLGAALPGVEVPALDEVIQRATAKDREARFPSMAAFAAALVEATRTDAYVAAAQAAAAAPATAPRTGAPGGTWVRGPGAQLHRPVTPAVEPPRTGTAILGAPTPPPAPTPTPGAPPLRLARTEVPPPARTPRSGGGRGGRWAALAVLLVAGGASAAWAGWVGWGGAGAGPETAEGPAGAPEPAPSPVPAPAQAAAGPPAEAPAVVPAKAAGQAPVPADQVLRERLLAREIWLKANAEFVAGNLGNAREILATVPDDPEIAGKVRDLQDRIERISAEMGRARAFAARGDCVQAIAAYDRVLEIHPGFRDAAAGRAACVQMLPPSLAE